MAQASRGCCDVKCRPTKSPLWHWFIGKCNMCRKMSVCERFERRTINGVIGACHTCEYRIRERRKLWVLRILTVVFLFAFIGTTHAYLREDVEITKTEIEHVIKK